MNETSTHDLSLQRILNAPVALVWEAWTKPEHIPSWWGPQGMKTEVVELDFKPGGAWKYVMITPDGKEFPTEGVFSEIVENAKIVTTGEFGMLTNGVILTILFEAQGDKTQLTFTVTHPSEEYCKQQEKMGAMNGWGTVLSNLETHVATLVG